MNFLSVVRKGIRFNYVLYHIGFLLIKKKLHFPLFYRVVVFIAPLQGLCYTARDAVDWCNSPTAETVLEKLQPQQVFADSNLNLAADTDDWNYKVCPPGYAVASPDGHALYILL